MSSKSIMAVTILIIAVRGWSQGIAREQVVSIASNDVTIYIPEGNGLGKYYELDFQLPEAGAESPLQSAILEFYVDVESVVQGNFRWIDADSLEHVGYKATTPLMGAYALTSPIDGAVREEQLDQKTAAWTPLLIGEGRRVMIDVTRIIRTFLKDPSTNRGIVIGSLLEPREGDFTLKEGVFPDGSRAKIHLTFATTE